MLDYIYTPVRRSPTPITTSTQINQLNVLNSSVERVVTRSDRDTDLEEIEDQAITPIPETPVQLRSPTNDNTTRIINTTPQHFF